MRHQSDRAVYGDHLPADHLDLRSAYSAENHRLVDSLDDAQIALAVINTTYASQIGLTPAKDGIFVEGKESPYVNLIVAREDNKDAENVKKFVQAYQSDEVYEAANKIFNGGAVKGW